MKYIIKSNKRGFWLGNGKYSHDRTNVKILDSLGEAKRAAAQLSGSCSVGEELVIIDNEGTEVDFWTKF